MMKKLVSLLALLFLLQAQSVMAHSGGHDPIAPEKAVSIALDAATHFTSTDPGLGFGKLTESWKGLSRDVSKVVSKGEGYYIVSVENKAEGKTMFVLISASGDIYDANFSGDFPKLK